LDSLDVSTWYDLSSRFDHLDLGETPMQTNILR